MKEMFDLVIYAFNQEPTAERQERFEKLLSHTQSYGFLIDEQLTSQVMATPFQVNFHGVRYPMAGIGYVASYPEYRGEGGISAIMKEMLADCETKGCPFLLSTVFISILSSIWL